MSSPSGVAVSERTGLTGARPLEHSVQRARSSERNTPSDVAAYHVSRKRVIAVTLLLSAASDHVRPPALDATSSRSLAARIWPSSNTNNRLNDGANRIAERCR